MSSSEPYSNNAPSDEAREDIFAIQRFYKLAQCVRVRPVGIDMSEVNVQAMQRIVFSLKRCQSALAKVWTKSVEVKNMDKDFSSHEQSRALLSNHYQSVQAVDGGAASDIQQAKRRIRARIQY